MKKKIGKGKNSDSPEQISDREALERIKRFVERKDKFVDAVKAGKNRGVSAGKKG
jgi:hypothetical protein